MTNVNISDLGITTALETGDKIVVRKSGANYDTAITKQNIAKSLGNTAAIGFVATSDTANKIILTPTNGAELDDYYDQMLITFVSPITSNADVEIKINGLAYKNIIVNGNSIAVTAGDYIEAYYHAADDEFKQSNNIEATIYTPEFTAVNSTVTGNTLITLTSAAGNHKTAYYNGMLITFVNPANTLAGINVNVDGLGAVPLEVRTASGYIIPANTIVTAVYQTDRFVCNKSIQGTSLDLYGYVASSSTANQVQLNSVSGITGSNYVTGMRVSFVSPITTNAATKLKLPGMALKNFYKYGSTDNKPLVANNFYEAVYIGDAATGAFYETNATTDTIYTNEYTATAVIAGDESSTTYTLTSAIGIPKPAYYNAMSILFTSPVDSKGDQIVNVDGLGNKALDDNDIQNEDITAGDAIMAIYDGTKFIKHRFSTVEDPVPGPAPDITVTVGTGGRFITIKAAIDGIIRDYGWNGNGQKILVQLLPGYEWKISDGIIEADGDLSWITIISDTAGNNIVGLNGLNFNSSFFIKLRGNNGVSFNIKGIFTGINVNNTGLFTPGSITSNFNVILNDLTITIPYIVVSREQIGLWNLIQINNCVLNIKSILKNYTVPGSHSKLNYINTLNILNTIFTSTRTPNDGQTDSPFFCYYESNPQQQNPVIKEINLINCTFNLYASGDPSRPFLFVPLNLRAKTKETKTGYVIEKVSIQDCVVNTNNTPVSDVNLDSILRTDQIDSVELINCTMQSPLLNTTSISISANKNCKIVGGNFINLSVRNNYEINIIRMSNVFLEKDSSGNYAIGNRQVDANSTVTIIP